MKQLSLLTTKAGLNIKEQKQATTKIIFTKGKDIRIKGRQIYGGHTK